MAVNKEVMGLDINSMSRIPIGAGADLRSELISPVS